MRHLTLLMATILACGPGDSGAADTGPAYAPSPDTPPVRAPDAGPHAASVLDHYDFHQPARRFDLPGRLDEISGLAMTPDGRLFAHDDERGRVHEIDPRTGEVGKHFDLGNGRLEGDFEGIAVIGERFFMVTSTGWLYEFREGEDGENVPYRVTDTGLGPTCEVEGLDYDPASDALVFACKKADHDGDWIYVHRLGVDPAAGRLPVLRIARAALEPFDVDEDFEPSALVVLPSGTYLLASAAQEALMEVDGEGRVLGALALSQDTHPQTEGLALDAEATLYLADEENEEDAWLTAYAARMGTRP